MKRGLMMVRSNPKPGMEDEYNDWYENTHIPEILATPGFKSARRYKTYLGADNGVHEYVAIYEYEDEDDLSRALEAMREGKRDLRDVIDMDPPPVVTQFELIHEQFSD